MRPSSRRAIYLAETRDWSTLDLLLDIQPSAAKKRDSFGMYPLHWACTEAELPIELLKKLLSLYPEGKEMKNNGDLLPIQVAMRSKLSKEHIELLETKYPVIKRFRESLSTNKYKPKKSIASEGSLNRELEHIFSATKTHNNKAETDKRMNTQQAEKASSDNQAIEESQSDTTDHAESESLILQSQSSTSTASLVNVTPSSSYISAKSSNGNINSQIGKSEMKEHFQSLATLTEQLQTLNDNIMDSQHTYAELAENLHVLSTSMPPTTKQHCRQYPRKQVEPVRLTEEHKQRTTKVDDYLHILSNELKSDSAYNDPAISEEIQADYSVIWFKGDLGLLLSSSHGRVGARVDKISSYAKVNRFISKRSVSNFNKIHVGDYLIGVNGENIREMEFNDLVKFIKKLPKPITLGFQRQETIYRGRTFLSLSKPLQSSFVSDSSCAQTFCSSSPGNNTTFMSSVVNPVLSPSEQREKNNNEEFRTYQTSYNEESVRIDHHLENIEKWCHDQESHQTSIVMVLNDVLTKCQHLESVLYSYASKELLGNLQQWDEALGLENPKSESSY